MSKGRRLDGRVAVVTGGAQGIGLGIATRLAEEGATVILADIGLAKAEAAAARLAEQGCLVSAIRVDIGDDASVADLARAVDAAHGRCEILVNNAAIGADTHIETMSMADYQQVIRINQDGAVRMVMAFVPLIKKAGEGRRILNIASIQGLRGWPNQIAYATAKGAIVNFTRALACDLAPYDIMVNALPRASSTRPCRSGPTARMNMTPTGSATSMSSMAASRCAVTAVPSTWEGPPSSCAPTMPAM